jgi:hypothetical protein
MNEPPGPSKPKTPRKKRCDLCRLLYVPGTGSLKGLCDCCSKGLGGGPYSARIVKQEAKALADGMNMQESQRRREKRQQKKNRSHP